MQPLQELSCKNNYLLYQTFIKLLERFIKELAAILRLEVPQVTLGSSYKFKSKKVAISFIANLMQHNFSRFMN